ncbi:lipid kinase YegS [bioreactor metagenome]|uniref:Lipid kinase YegS n=1 Tax=bioreactor metagenome TaxID=1076179 RepID=A0A644WK23_9ZZZZ
MTHQKSIIIVNPVSGTHHSRSSLQKIRQWAESSGALCEIESTRYRGHASELAAEALAKGYNHFIVAGGDGTLNEVASVIYTKPGVSLGIVPRGSGNGLALHLGIPLKTEKALETAFASRTIACDVGLLNNKPFFSVAGVGFDAMVAEKFARMKGRGLKNYIRAVMKHYPRYKPSEYEIEINGKTFREKALMISFANSNQFGNNTSLSPDASLTDGLIDLCIMHKPPVPAALILSPLLFLKKMNRTGYLKIHRTDKAEIKVILPAFYHIDGDPFILETSKISLGIIPQTLNIHVK